LTVCAQTKRLFFFSFIVSGVFNQNVNTLHYFRLAKSHRNVVAYVLGKSCKGNNCLLKMNLVLSHQRVLANHAYLNGKFNIIVVLADNVGR